MAPCKHIVVDEETGSVEEGQAPETMSRLTRVVQATVLGTIGIAILMLLANSEFCTKLRRTSSDGTYEHIQPIHRKLDGYDYLEHVTFNDCSNSEINKIQESHNKAVQQVDNALDKLPGGRHESFNRDENYWFGGNVNADILKKGFRRIKVALTQEGLIYSCKLSSQCNSDIAAKMWFGGTGDDDEPNVVLCSSWFGTTMTTDKKYPREPDGIDRDGDGLIIDIGKQSRSGVIIHELTHFFGSFAWPSKANAQAGQEWVQSAGDHHYGDENGVQLVSTELHNFAQRNSDLAMNNAASWQAFADSGPCWGDGKLCGLGTTCKVCCDDASWWGTKAMTACGKEPQWKDGARCAVGTTCKRCKNKATYWTSKMFTACGQERCLPKGRKCAKGTSCKRCCNGSKYKWKKAMAYCK